MRRVPLEPTNYTTRLAALLDDGSDVTFVLGGGTYSSPFTILKPSGGRVVLDATCPGQVSITGDMRIAARDIQVANLDFAGGTTTLGSQDADAINVCEPESISVAQCNLTGGAALLLRPSESKTLYTLLNVHDLVLNTGSVGLGSPERQAPVYTTATFDQVVSTDGTWLILSQLSGCTSVLLAREVCAGDGPHTLVRLLQNQQVTIEHRDGLYASGWTFNGDAPSPAAARIEFTNMQIDGTVLCSDQAALHFYDCLLADVALDHSAAVASLHTTVPTTTQILTPGATFISDEESRSVRDSVYHRVVGAVTTPLPYDLAVLDPSFEAKSSAWVLTEGALFYDDGTGPPSYDGPYSAASGLVTGFLQGRNGFGHALEEDSYIEQSLALSGAAGACLDLNFLAYVREATWDNHGAGADVTLLDLHYRLDGGAWVLIDTITPTSFTEPVGFKPVMDVTVPNKGYTEFTRRFTPGAAYDTIDFRFSTNRTAIPMVTLRVDWYWIDVVKLRRDPC